MSSTASVQFTLPTDTATADRVPVTPLGDARSRDGGPRDASDD